MVMKKWLDKLSKISASIPSAFILTPIPIFRTRTRPTTTYRTRRRFAISFPPTIIQRPRLIHLIMKSKISGEHRPKLSLTGETDL